MFDDRIHKSKNSLGIKAASKRQLANWNQNNTDCIKSTGSLMIILPVSQFVCPYFGNPTFKESEIVHFKSLNFPKLLFNNFKISKVGIATSIQKRGQKRKCTIVCWLSFQNGLTIRDLQRVDKHNGSEGVKLTYKKRKHMNKSASSTS